MFSMSRSIRHTLLVSLLSCIAGVPALAACQVRPVISAPLRYVANEEARGALTLSVVCQTPADRYSLAISAPGGSFDLASGAYVLAAVGRAGSRLNVVLENALGSLGGVSVPQVFEGSQTFSYPLRIPVGQWAVSGQPTLNVSIALSDVAP